MPGKTRTLGRLRSWALFVVWIGWIISWAFDDYFGVVPSVIATLLGMLWLRSLLDPEPWSRGTFRRDNLAYRAARVRARAARRNKRLGVRMGLPVRTPKSTQRARAAARRGRNRARDAGP